MSTAVAPPEEPGQAVFDLDEADSDGRALMASARRLGSAYPEIEPRRLARMLVAAYRQTEAARVQQYRVVLAERRVRRSLVVHLRARGRPGGAPGLQG